MSAACVWIARPWRLAALLLALACAARADEPPEAPKAEEEPPEPEDLPPEVMTPPDAPPEDPGEPPTPEDLAPGVVTPPDAPPPQTTEEAEAARKKAVKWEIDGYLAEALIYRNASGEASDNDFDSRTNVLFDAAHGDHGWHLRFNGLLHWDIAGDSAPDDPLRDFWDQFSGAAQGRLYEAYADSPRFAGGTLLLRAGRQYLEEEVFLQFDGGRLDIDLGSKADGLNLSLLGGVPVYFPDESRDGDWLVGAVVRGKVGKKTRARLSYYHVSQNFEGVNDPVTDPPNQAFVVPAGQVDDDLLAFSVWHDLRENLRFYGMFDMLEWEANELQLQLRWFSADTRWNVIAAYNQLFERLVNVANEISPYVPLLGSYEPFLLASLRATFRPDDRWILQGAIAYRALENSDDEGTFNHEYWQYQAGATRLGVLTEGLDVTLTINGYTSDAGPDVFALTGGIDYRLTKKVSLNAGVDYSYYKYVVQQGTERDDVWTYYGGVEWEVRPKMELDAGLAIDVDDLFTYTTLTVRLTVRF